jgi:hypothetical protein
MFGMGLSGWTTHLLVGHEFPITVFCTPAMDRYLSAMLGINFQAVLHPLPEQTKVCWERERRGDQMVKSIYIWYRTSPSTSTATQLRYPLLPCFTHLQTQEFGERIWLTI